MMICLSKEGYQKNNISIGEVLLLLSIHNNVDLDLAQKELIKKGYITANMNDLFQQIGWRLTNKGAEIIDSVIIDSDKNQQPEDKLVQLATRLKEIFPKGKKDGTNYYWADGVALIVRRLKLFFKKYGDAYSDEQIIQATLKYVEGFNGNYTYMRLLKYFIFKEKIGAAGEVEGDSELISYIENADQTDNFKNDWTSTLK
jgi:hypothetical protein